MNEVADETISDFGKVRLETLSDGIFGIAMTVLILTINAPDFPDSATNDQVWEKLVGMWPNVMAFVASFVTLGMFWMTHHVAFRYLTRSDRVILWLNMYFLLLVTMVPFTTNLYAGDVDNVIVNTIFGANLILMGLLNYAIWAYANRMGYVFKELSPKARRFSTRRILTAPVIATMAMVAATFQPRFAEMIYLAMVPLFMITVRRFPMKKLQFRGNAAEKTSST